MGGTVCVVKQPGTTRDEQEELLENVGLNWSMIRQCLDYAEDDEIEAPRFRDLGYTRELTQVSRPAAASGTPAPSSGGAKFWEQPPLKS